MMRNSSPLSLLALIAALSLPAVFAACTSHEPRTAVLAHHEDTSRDIMAVDQMIVERKKEFIDKCYYPVLNQEVSDSPRPCVTALQQILERRYVKNWNQEHLDMAADDLFFEGSGQVQGVNSRILAFKRTLGPSFTAAGFTSNQEILDYYRQKYTFQKK
jgi:hypothetical protein